MVDDEPWENPRPILGNSQEREKLGVYTFLQLKVKKPKIEKPTFISHHNHNENLDK